MSFDKFENGYNELLALLEIDYADCKEAYRIAISISDYNLELDLTIMINIINANPTYLGEDVRDSIFLYVQNEGNRNTYKYIMMLLNQETDGDVISYLEDMKDSLIEKYKTLAINLI